MKAETFGDKYLDVHASSLFHREASETTESFMHFAADVNPMCYNKLQLQHKNSQQIIYMNYFSSSLPDSVYCIISK